MSILLITDINPEPWQAPIANVGRKGGKVFAQMHSAPTMRAYQEALRECITEAYPQLPMFGAGFPLRLNFLFWRKLDKYVKNGRNMTRKPADATNLQKSTEDALQGLFYHNDRDIVSIHTDIVAQSTEVEPMILIVCRLVHSPVNRIWDRYIENTLLLRDHPYHKWPRPGNVYWDDEVQPTTQEGETT